MEIKSKGYGELGTAGTAAEFYAFQPGPGAWEFSIKLELTRDMRVEGRSEEET